MGAIVQFAALLATIRHVIGQQTVDSAIRFHSYFLLESHLQRHLLEEQSLHVRNARSASAKRPAVMYMPVGGPSTSSCPSAADLAASSIAKMAFLSMMLTVFNSVVNIANNLNNSNNKNNINQNNENLSSNNNNANLVDILLPKNISRSS
jgi:hypothetical protein